MPATEKSSSRSVHPENLDGFPQDSPAARPRVAILSIIKHLLGSKPAAVSTCLASRQVLSECGDMSSPSVLFALERALNEGTPDESSELVADKLRSRLQRPRLPDRG